MRMKKQYFGDKRDLFKFDLIKNVVKETGVSGFTYIPMLTPNDKTGQGKLRNNLSSPNNTGHKNRGLIEFFKRIPANRDERDVGIIKEYFEKIFIPTNVYRKGDYFDRANRNPYFKGVEKVLLQNALIFVDPDTGLEPETVKPNEKHLLYSEAEDLYANMGKHSILAIIQFRRKGDSRKFKVREDIEAKRTKLCKTTEDMCVFITDYNITFFCLSKNFETKRRLSKAIISYKKGNDDNLDCGGIVL